MSTFHPRVLPFSRACCGRAFGEVVIVSDEGVRSAYGTGAGTLGVPGPLFAEFGGASDDGTLHHMDSIVVVV